MHDVPWLVKRTKGNVMKTLLQLSGMTAAVLFACGAHAQTAANTANQNASGASLQTQAAVQTQAEVQTQTQAQAMTPSPSGLQVQAQNQVQTQTQTQAQATDPQHLGIQAQVQAQVGTQTQTQAGNGGPPAGTPGGPGPNGPMYGLTHQHSPNPNASANAAAVQAVLQKFDASRDQVIAARQTLIDQLAAATTDQDRDRIRDQLRQETQDMQQQQRTMAKEIRYELRNLRRQRAGGG